LIRFRTAVLLLSGLSLIIWYFVGGKALIAWELAVRDAAAGGWDISQAYVDPSPHPLRGISLVAGTTFFLSGFGTLIMDGIRKIQKAMNDRTRQTN
jgi:hypothetical protein